MSAESTIESIINEAIASAQDAQQQATGYTDQAQTAASTSIQTLPTAGEVDEIDLAVPLLFDPGQDLGNDFKTQYDLSEGELTADFGAKVSEFMNNWFPDLTTCIKNNLSSWLCTAIGGGTGLDPTVEAQLWQRGRDREARATSEQASAMIDKYAGMGWDLGDEYIADKADEAVASGRRATSEMNRDMTIEFAKIRIETAKFAITTAANLRLGIIGALNDYLRTFLTIPAEARQKATEYVNAKRRLWEGMQAYYRALVDSKDLLLRGQIANQARDIEMGKLTVQAIVAVIQGRVQAAIAAADTMGDIAASARGGLNSLAHLGNITNQDA